MTKAVSKAVPTTRAWGERKQNMKLVHAFEMLDAIEVAEGAEKVNLLKAYGSKTPLNYLLSLNFRDDITLDLPEGMPPLKPKEMDTASHPDMVGTLGSTIHRLMNCTPKAKITAHKKEDIFVQVLLACPLKDAEIVCSAKDKALEELYPSIDADLVKSVFPRFVS